jgi:hypothetical protein
MMGRDALLRRAEAHLPEVGMLVQRIRADGHANPYGVLLFALGGALWAMNALPDLPPTLTDEEKAARAEPLRAGIRMAAPYIAAALDLHIGILRRIGDDAEAGRDALADGCKSDDVALIIDAACDLLWARDVEREALARA